MKKLLVLFVNIGLVLHISAQTTDPKAESLYNKLMSAARPEIKNWVYSTAGKYRYKDVNKNVLIANKDFNIVNAQNADLDALTFLVMMQASKEAEDDLKQSLNNMKQVNTTKAKQREQVQSNTPALKFDSLHNKNNGPDANHDDQLKIQILTDRRQKALETISNLMKKVSETENSIIQNLK